MALVTLIITGIVFAATNHNRPSEVLSTEAEQESESEKEKTTEKNNDISKEEYYKEEEALDQDEENVLYEDTESDTPSSQSNSDAHPYYIKVNRQANCVTVYSKDAEGNYTVPVRAMVCSVGLNGGTPTGVFRTSTKYLWRALFGGVYGQYAYRINGPILFHSVPYYSQNKADLESEEYNKLGQDASMGCIRMAVKDVKWLMDNCPTGTTVEIYDSADPGPLGKPSAVKIDLNSPNKGWDPTDPDEKNPWRATPPVITGVANKNVERGNAVDVLSGISATDFQGNSLTVSTSGTVNANVCGNYGVTYTATDAFGNSTSASATFAVKDTKAPVVKVNGEIIVNDNSDASNVSSVIMAHISATDGNENLPASAISIDISKLQQAMREHKYGSYACTASAKDSSGIQSSTISFQVKYEDTAPTITSENSYSTSITVTAANATQESVIQAASVRAKEWVDQNSSVSDAVTEGLSKSVDVVADSVTVKEEQTVQGTTNTIPKTITCKVIITAKDKAGNTSTKEVECTVTVLVTNS